MHCILSLSLQHPTPGHSVRLNYITWYAILQHLAYLEHDACNLRTSIKLNRICVFGQKMCELAASGKDSEWGRGGLATYVCNANEHGPPQLFLHCCAYARQRLCSASSSDLMVLRTIRSTIGERSFQSAAASTWNAPSHSVRSSTSVLQFRSRLKTELFARSYQQYY